MVWVAGGERESRGQLVPAPAEERAQRDAEWGGGSPWVAEAPGPLQSLENIAPPPHREGTSLPYRGGQMGARLAELEAGVKRWLLWHVAGVGWAKRGGGRH